GALPRSTASRLQRISYATLNLMRLSPILFCGLLATATTLATGYGTPNASQPEVFLVTIDTLRADHIHCYGYESIQTPALDALAKAGIRFALAFNPSHITNHSHIN